MTLQECNILLVDDEPELLTLVGKLLKNEGYRHVHMVAGCAEAMWYTQENDYQLVLLDIMLPDGAARLAMTRSIVFSSSVRLLSSRMKLKA